MELKSFRPKKSFGQNFLKNPRVIEKIMGAAELSGEETVVEVGPGFGILTEALLNKTGGAQKTGKVIAIEKDRALFEYLKEKFRAAKNLELIYGDALEFTPPKEPFCLVANIPYSITSPLLDHFIRDAACTEKPNLPQRAVLLVQKEVAEKICASPPRMNVLALHIQPFGAPRLVASISRQNFQPMPKVDSSIIEINFYKPAPTYATKEFFELIHRGFSHKRKMLRATLPKDLLQKAGIDETRRPETLTIEEWRRISRFMDM